MTATYKRIGIPIGIVKVSHGILMDVPDVLHYWPYAIPSHIPRVLRKLILIRKIPEITSDEDKAATGGWQRIGLINKTSCNTRCFSILLYFRFISNSQTQVQIFLIWVKVIK
jgi:hypothetical protein